MQLTSFTDYALRTLVYLGLQPDSEALISVKQICEHFNMPRNHVIKVTQQLSQQNYIKSTRGRQGGIKLARPANEINVGQVVRDFEKRLVPFDCEGSDCPVTSRCRVKALMRRAQHAFLKELDGFTIADMLEEPRDLIALLKIEAEPLCSKETIEA